MPALREHVGEVDAGRDCAPLQGPRYYVIYKWKRPSRWTSAQSFKAVHAEAGHRSVLDSAAQDSTLRARPVHHGDEVSTESLAAIPMTQRNES